eukprot:1610898-Rhodomonas_salina.2
MPGSYQPAPVNSAMSLRAFYGMSSTEHAYLLPGFLYLRKLLRRLLRALRRTYGLPTVPWYCLCP